MYCESSFNLICFFFFKQKTAYEMRISDWSSDVCSSDLHKQNSTWLPIQFGSNRKPRIVIGPNAVVEGDLVFEREVTLYVHSSARIGKVTGATPIAFDTPRAPRD